MCTLSLNPQVEALRTDCGELAEQLSFAEAKMREAEKEKALEKIGIDPALKLNQQIHAMNKDLSKAQRQLKASATSAMDTKRLADANAKRAQDAEAELERATIEVGQRLLRHFRALACLLSKGAPD